MCDRAVLDESVTAAGVVQPVPERTWTVRVDTLNEIQEVRCITFLYSDLILK